MTVECAHIPGVCLNPRFTTQVSYGYTPAPGDGCANGDTGGDKPDVTYGCAIVPSQLKTVQTHVDAAVAAGAKVLTGGKTDGNYFPPTVLTMPTPSADSQGSGSGEGTTGTTTAPAATGVAAVTPILETETFGPVLRILRVPTAQAAVAAANDSSLGLGGYVFTGDTAEGGLGERLAGELATGGVVVNDTLLQFVHSGVPFGGRRGSGVGRTGGREGMLAFTTTQAIVVCEPGGEGDWGGRYSYGAKLAAVRKLYGKSSA